jgi:hypothetical protein
MESRWVGTGSMKKKEKSSSKFNSGIGLKLRCGGNVLSAYLPEEYESLTPEQIGRMS